MFKRRKRTADEEGVGTVDGGEGRGVPLGGHDERPATGYRQGDDEFSPDDEEANDRRRDPLRKP